jgi:hypothetical protein
MRNKSFNFKIFGRLKFFTGQRIILLFFCAVLASLGTVPSQAMALALSINSANSPKTPSVLPAQSINYAADQQLAGTPSGTSTTSTKNPVDRTPDHELVGKRTVYIDVHE